MCGPHIPQFGIVSLRPLDARHSLRAQSFRPVLDGIDSSTCRSSQRSSTVYPVALNDHPLVTGRPHTLAVSPLTKQHTAPLCCRCHFLKRSPHLQCRPQQADTLVHRSRSVLLRLRHGPSRASHRLCQPLADAGRSSRYRDAAGRRNAADNLGLAPMDILRGLHLYSSGHSIVLSLASSERVSRRRLWNSTRQVTTEQPSSSAICL
jgi:hypothetical protein